jgi:hypothetical protein
MPQLRTRREALRSRRQRHRATWLRTEINNADIDLAFGLCDLGLGGPFLIPYPSVVHCADC